MNQEFQKFKKKKPKIFIIGYSLGGVIAYDILCHQKGGLSHKDLHHDWRFPKLLFLPTHLFLLGSPLAPIMAMRNQELSGYKIPPCIKLQNIIHLYDPLVPFPKFIAGIPIRDND
jgi:hypothetical protein